MIPRHKYHPNSALVFAGAVVMVTLFVLSLFVEPAYPGIPPKLIKQARFLAAHGGVTGSCHGCATLRMQALTRKLVEYRFRPAGAGAVSTALCVVRGESGFNPGAISHTGDYGVAQVNRATWESVYPEWWQPVRGFRYALLDPVFNVNVMWSMSRWGTSWSPWVVYNRGYCS